jgi:hypothetical protein
MHSIQSQIEKGLGFGLVYTKIRYGRDVILQKQKVREVARLQNHLIVLPEYGLTRLATASRVSVTRT